MLGVSGLIPPTHCRTVRRRPCEMRNVVPEVVRHSTICRSLLFVRSGNWGHSLCRRMIPEGRPATREGDLCYDPKANNRHLHSTIVLFRKTNILTCAKTLSVFHLMYVVSVIQFAAHSEGDICVWEEILCVCLCVWWLYGIHSQKAYFSLWLDLVNESFTAKGVLLKKTMIKSWAAAFFEQSHDYSQVWPLRGILLKENYNLVSEFNEFSTRDSNIFNTTSPNRITTGRCSILLRPFHLY